MESVRDSFDAARLGLPATAARVALELTITKPDSPAFQPCRALLVRENLVQNAIAIGGEGYFTSMPGVKGRNLGVIRLDTISTCELKPRR